MRSLRNVAADVWDALNPSEPSPRYLVTFWLTAAALFLIATLIGYY